MTAKTNRKVTITISGLQFQAELNGSKTAEAILRVLPVSARGNFWGEEIYFPVPIQCQAENPQQVVEPGTVAYWPPGGALCIFWGPTPASLGDECRPASPVNLAGRITSDLSPLKSLASAEVCIEKASE
jgi:hypothetical protein